ncbi:MAG TPA: AzlD domain-containing protein [Acidimicrobiia bacterium]|nr:AzlD domain-containing protein [Acidimicrobiia bacterium]
MIAFLAILVVGVGSYLLRAVFIVILAKRRIPEVALAALQFVGPAVLSALVVALLIDGEGNVVLGFPKLIALVLGGVVAYKTRNHIYTLVFGMSAFWLVGFLL